MEENITSVKWGEMKESATVYTSDSVDALIAKERETAIERENAIKTLIDENDAIFDDMVTALDPIAELEDFIVTSDGEYTVNGLATRINIITGVLKSLRQGILE